MLVLVVGVLDREGDLATSGFWRSSSALGRSRVESWLERNDCVEGADIWILG